MEKTVFSRRIAYELRKQGCKILRVEPNHLHPQFDCYIFEADEKFLKLLNGRNLTLALNIKADGQAEESE